ncbi:hypothetical protein [Streptomyces parvulus]
MTKSLVVGMWISRNTKSSGGFGLHHDMGFAGNGDAGEAAAHSLDPAPRSEEASA